MASIHLKAHDALFLHLPKTAGYSTSSALATLPGAQSLPVRGMEALHGAAAYAAGRLGDTIFADTFSFAVVRNPWDWAVSGWKHVTENTKAYPDQKPDFRTFLTGGWHVGLRRNPNPMKFASPEIFVRYHCFVTQWDHLRLGDGTLAPLAYTARFERLEEDLRVIGERLSTDLSLPHKNRSNRSHYVDYYTEDLVDLVGRANAPLIRRFGYRFGD